MCGRQLTLNTKKLELSGAIHATPVTKEQATKHPQHITTCPGCTTAPQMGTGLLGLTGNGWHGEVNHSLQGPKGFRETDALHCTPETRRATKPTTCCDRAARSS